jgi:hypothetical protein
MEELFKKYPKAAKKAVEYYTEAFKKSIEESDVDETYKEYARETVNIDDENVAKMIEVTPRGAFDFFDDNDIYITTPVSAADGYFKWEIYSEAEVYETSEYLNNRKMAEVAAVEKAFEILNEQL